MLMHQDLLRIFLMGLTVIIPDVSADTTVTDLIPPDYNPNPFVRQVASPLSYTTKKYKGSSIPLCFGNASQDFGLSPDWHV